MPSSHRAHTGKDRAPDPLEDVRHSTPINWPPDTVPVLSRGKHRRPRNGACFMELASYMAGEPWSDHPECTHPALAALAREINDYTTDEGRHRLAPMVPSVIGLTSDDPQLEIDIALRAASAALPIAAEERQRVLAVGILRCRAERGADSDSPTDQLDAASQEALDSVPIAAAWAAEFVKTSPWRPRRARRRPYVGIIHHAARSIGEACVDDPDTRLYELLRDTIDDCRRRIPAKPPARSLPTRVTT